MPLPVKKEIPGLPRTETHFDFTTSQEATDASEIIRKAYPNAILSQNSSRLTHLSTPGYETGDYFITFVRAVQHTMFHLRESNRKSLQDKVAELKRLVDKWE